MPATAPIVSAAPIPPPSAVAESVVGGGIGAALTIGAVAGIYPALRASRLAPTEALRAV